MVLQCKSELEHHGFASEFYADCMFDSFAPVLDVFSNFQPVKSSIKFIDGLLNSEVTTDSTSVSELEYLLPIRARDNCANRNFGSVKDWSVQAENTVFDNELVKPRLVVPQVMRFFFKFFLSPAL